MRSSAATSPARSAATASPAYLALNPNGLVPTIDDDGFILWESNSIVRYLACKYAGSKIPSLYPANVARRADAERWMDWQQTTLAAPMGVLFRALIRKPAEETDAAAAGGGAHQATQSWEILDRALEGRSYAAGEELSIADIALGNAVHRWHRLPIERPALRQVGGWYARLRQRPAYDKYIACCDEEHPCAFTRPR